MAVALLGMIPYVLCAMEKVPVFSFSKSGL